jgi:hypothetical protein
MRFIDTDGRIIKIVSRNPVVVAQFAGALDAMEAADPRLRALVRGLRASRFVHTITDEGWDYMGGMSAEDDKANATNGVGTGTTVYIEPTYPDFEWLLAHELSHSEDSDTGTLARVPDCPGCANVTESKAVRMENMWPNHRRNPRTDYFGQPVKNPTQVPVDPRAGHVSGEGPGSNAQTEPRHNEEQ